MPVGFSNIPKPAEICGGPSKPDQTLVLKQRLGYFEDKCKKAPS